MLRRPIWRVIGLGFALSAGVLVLASCDFDPFDPHALPPVLPPGPTLYFCSGFTASNCVAQYVPTYCAGGGWDNLGNCALTNCVAPIPTLVCNVQ